MKRTMIILFALLQVTLFTFAEEVNREKDLFFAIRDGSTETVGEILDAGFPVDYKYSNKGDLTPLHFSIIAGHPETTRLLLDYGADMYTQGEDNLSPFDISVLGSRFSLSEIFLEKGYDIDTPCGKMAESEFAEIATPLTFCIMATNVKGVEFLIEHGADPDLPAEYLFRGVSDNQKWLVDRFIESGFDINYAIEKYNRSTALHIANENGNVEMVEYLLERGADINARSASLKTVFDVAVGLNNFNLADLYLEKYSYDIGQLDNWHRTALFGATVTENLPALRYLFEKGLDPDSYQYDASHYLNAYFGSKGRNNQEINIDVVKLYLDYGLSLSKQDACGYTYFHNAAITNDVRLLEGLSFDTEFLNIRTSDEGSNTPLIFSVFDRNFDVTRKLIELGADPNVQNSEGVTALFYLVAMEEPDMADFLIENGADVNIADNQGNTIFDICPESMKEKIMAYKQP